MAMSTQMVSILARLWASLSSASFVRSASFSLTFAVSSLIRLFGLLAQIKSSLKSFRKGNFALKAARSLFVTTHEDEEAGSLVRMVCDALSIMMSRVSLIEDVSSSGVRAEGIQVGSVG